MKRGDKVKVKLISIDDRGRMRLSRRAAMSAEPETEPETETETETAEHS